MTSKSFTFRLPEDLRLELEKISEKDGRTLSNLIIKILRDYVEKHSVKGKRDN